MRHHISNEKWKKIGSVGITLTIVLMLVLSGPASAVTIKISGLDTEYTKGNNVEFQVSITLHSPDKFVPISNFSLNLSGPTSKIWIFDPNGTLIPDDPTNIVITNISTPNASVYGPGVGYGVDSNTGEGFDFGSGFGYGSNFGAGNTGNVTFTYNVTLYTTNLATGTYKVTANLNTDNSTKPSFTSSEATFTVNAAPCIGCGGRGGGGGGGGGGTGEKNYNIELYENDRQFVYDGQLTSFNYSYKGNIAKYLNFTGEGSLGKILTKVEMLYNTSTMIELDAPGEVYRNLNVWTGFSGWFSSDHLSDPTLTYTVNKSWVRNNNIKLSSISLYFYDAGKWIKLPTQKIDEDSLKYYFKSDLIINGSLGHMAVSGQFNPPPPKPTPIPTPIPTPTPTPEITPTPTPISWSGVWSESIPGFQMIGALLIIITLYVIGRRRPK